MAETHKYKNQSVVEIGTVEGNLELDNCRSVVPQQGKEIVVTGDVYVRGETLFEGSLRAHSLQGRSRDTITIDGDLTVETVAENRKGSLRITGSAKGQTLQAGGSLVVDKDIVCGAAKGGGSVKVGGNANAGRLSGGGSVSVRGDVTAERVSAGGSVKIGGRSEIEEFSAGGAGKANDGKIEKVSVGGSFKAEGAIEIDEIDVGGSIRVGHGSKVRSIDVGGTFKSDGDLTFEEIDVGGTVVIGGAATGRTIDVGGKVSTDGPLNLSGDLEVGGTVVIGGDLTCEQKIKVGGKIEVEGKIHTFRIIVGGVIDADYVKATDGFRIGRRSEVSCNVESPEILVRERARMKSLYGDDIRIEERARIRSIYGRKIYIEREAVITGEVLYTESCEAERDVEFAEEPRKVDSLPPPEEMK